MVYKSILARVVKDDDKRCEITENGEIIIPDEISHIPEIKTLEDILTKHGDKITKMLFSTIRNAPQGHIISQRNWLTSKQNNQYGTILTIPLSWEGFCEKYSNDTGIYINPADKIEDITQKMGDYCFKMTALSHGHELGKNTFLLDNDKYLINKYGITFICTKKQVTQELSQKDEAQKKSMNIDFDGETYFIYGNHFKSKKGKDCFDITVTNPKHAFIINYWGAAYEHTNGLQGIRNPPHKSKLPQGVLYYNNHTKNRNGQDYLILPKNYKQCITTNYIQTGSKNALLELEDGRYVFSDTAKYGSGLSLICHKNNINDSNYGIKTQGLFKENKDITLNFNPSGNPYFTPGTYFVSEHKAKCFDTTTNDPQHMLVKVTWSLKETGKTGTPWSETPEEALYFTKRSSNAGNTGIDYFILPMDYIKMQKEERIKMLQNIKQPVPKLKLIK